MLGLMACVIWMIFSYFVMKTCRGHPEESKQRYPRYRGIWKSPQLEKEKSSAKPFTFWVPAINFQGFLLYYSWVFSLKILKRQNHPPPSSMGDRPIILQRPKTNAVKANWLQGLCGSSRWSHPLPFFVKTFRSPGGRDGWMGWEASH